MPAAKPQTRFLLRGSLLLAGFLVLWWVALLDPLLFVLRHATDFPLRWLSGGAISEPIRVDPSGEWTFLVPIPASRRAVLQQQIGTGGAPAPRTVRLVLPRSQVVRFTLCLPVFWALVLAAPLNRRSWRMLLGGTALLEILAVPCLLLYLGYTINTYLHLTGDGLAGWLLTYAEYLNESVAPYLAPILLALALNRELRSQVFSRQPGV